MAAPGTPATGSLLARLGLPARIAIGAALALLGALGDWVVFYTDVSARIDTTTRQTAQLNGELGTQQQAQATYFADRDELALRQQRQRELNKVLPAETEQAAFLSAVQQVSNVSGIDLKAWQPLDEKQEAFFAKVPMRLEMSGRFHQVAKFAFEMGKLDRIINVENIQLSAPRVVGDDVILTARCLATTFHMLKPKTEPKK
jgi:type IV pilus assembly protein PilO